MTTTRRSDGPNSRRRFLALAGAAAVTATAGCTGDASQPSDGGETDGDGSGGTDPDGTDDAGSCDELRGSPTAFEPADRVFPYLFDYSDTFEEYNADLNEADSLIGAQLGHSASATSTSYPVNLLIQQFTGTMNGDAANSWVTSFGQSERLEWTFTYDGTEIDGYEITAFEDPESSVWRFLLPVDETDGVRGVHVQFQDIRDETPCLEALGAIARDLVESLRANPEWSEPNSA